MFIIPTNFISGPFTPWTPAALNTKLWLDASDVGTITEVGGDVSQWDDKSGNDNHAVQGIGSAQPLAVDDSGLPSLYFDYISSKYMVVPDDVTLDFQYEGSFFAVIRDTNLAPSSYVWVRIDGNSNTSLKYATHNTATPRIAIAEDINSPRQLNWGTSGIIDTMIMEARFSTIVDTQRISVNGEPELTQTATPVTEINQDGTPEIRIGAQKLATARYFDGYMHELVFVGDYVTDVDRQKMEGYLAWKWGLYCNLPADHPYRFDGTLFGYGKLWQPSEITTELWLDASDASTITEAGGDISQWDDKSGNGNDAVQATGSAQPSYVAAGQNGLNVLRLDGMEYMTVDHGVVPDNDEASMVFIVAKGTDADEGMISNGNFAQNKSYSFATANASTDMVFWGGGSSPLTQIYTLNTTFEDMSIHEIAISMTDTRIDLYQDGDLLDTDASFTESVANDGTQEGVIGATQFLDDEDLNGDMCEVIVLKQEPDIITRQKMEGYLAWKWGLQGSLPVGHPFKLVCPLADTNYAFTIDGILVVDGLPVILP